jgi:hypothetical protein
MLRRTLLLTVLVCAIAVSPVGAQEALVPGTRVRLQIDSGALFRSNPVHLEGVVSKLEPDSLILTLLPGSGEARVPYGGVQTLQVSAGTEPRLRTVLEGVVDGAVSGALLGLIAHQTLRLETDRLDAVGRFSVVGSASGLLFGLIRQPDERWRRIPVPGR